MARRKLPYQPGDWFAVPLRDGGFALGLVARANRRYSILGYFFGPRYLELPTETETQGLTHRDAILVEICTDDGLVEQDWPIIHRPLPWSPEAWPLPAFARILEDEGLAWRVEYDELTLEQIGKTRVSPDAVRDLPRDRLAGAGAVEIGLTKLLSR